MSFSFLTFGQVSAGDVPVMIGGEAGMDACGGWGRVARLKADGDGFLAVRSGPGSKYGVKDKIHNGQGVIICEQRGKWYSIIYTKKDTDCGVSSPVASRRAYSGRCWSGWAHKNWIDYLAG